MARVRIKSNIPQFIAQCERMAAAFEGKKGVRLKILNEVAYAIHIEYGTSRIEARAMVRNSIPAILEYFEELWGLVKLPFTPEDIQHLMEQVKKFAIEEIRKRTPVKTGALRDGFEGVVEEY